MKEPLLVEIIAYAPTAFYHCMHCEVAWREMGASNRVHQEQIDNSLPTDLVEDYRLVSAWVRDVFRRHGDRVVVKVIDAASLEGFVVSLRYRVRQYPAVIVNHEARFTEKALETADEAIDRLLGQILTNPAQSSKDLSSADFERR